MGYRPVPPWPEPDASAEDWAAWIAIVEGRIRDRQRDLLVIFVCTVVIAGLILLSVITQ